MSIAPVAFPRDFIWGVSSAAYQIEGAAEEDGKGLSVWDMFCRKPGAIWQGHTGAVACDHYHRYAEDVALLHDLGAKAYRLSLSWPRVLPEGTGTLNPKGLAFYDRLLDALLAAGVQPWITLFHWDYPAALFARGGWLNRDSADWFADYVRIVVERFSDRVTHWTTHNEPQCFLNLGHYTGTHAPGICLPLAQVLQAGHHVLLAHGKAVQAIRAHAKRPARVTLSPAGLKAVPASDRPADQIAALQFMAEVRPHDLWNNTWWLDPIYLGHYPAAGMHAYGADVPHIAAGDMETIHQPLDFCGVNIYGAHLVRADAAGRPEVVLPPPGYNRTAQDDWHVLPEVMYWMPKFLYERYGLPIVVTENGHQNLDAPALDGRVHDPQRIDYLHRYLRALQRAIAAGVPIEGYFHWTLTDNFEWAHGYKVRVGLVYTDYQTLARIPKDSFAFYRSVIGANALPAV